MNMGSFNLTELFLNNIYLTLILPLWIFLIIMTGRFFSVYVNKKIIYSLTLLSSLFGAILCSGALWKLPSDIVLDTELPFIKINDFIINCGLYVDRIALVFAFVLFIISFLIQIFSIYYMKDEKKIYRFFALLNLFNFSMIGLFFSPNLFQTYFFWALAGVISYLLIGFEYFKKEKSLASTKVFIINRIGDTALIGAIILTSYFIYSYAPNKTFTSLAFIDMNTISTLIYAYTSTPLFKIICIMFILGALAKSAQIPFYTWLQDAMEAKLPISALLHSSTLVAAGIFLTLRMLPFYTFEPEVLKLISITGLITAFICSLSACTQTNPKKVLAYSTSAQLGLVFLAIGILNIKGAIILFIAHAFIKSMLFITLPKENEKWDYISFVLFLVSGLSLSGLIFSGMIAKEMIALNLEKNTLLLFSIISFLTAFYIIRIALQLSKKVSLIKENFNFLKLISPLVLLVMNILFYIYLHKFTQYKIAEPFWSALTAWIIVYILFIKKAFWKVPLLYPLAYNGFYLDKIYTKIIASIYDIFARFCNWLDIKVLGNYLIPIFFARTCVNTSSFIEEKLMNGCVNFTKNSLKKLSLINLRAQTGSVQRYNAYAFIIITIILVCLTLGYNALLIYFGG